MPENMPDMEEILAQMRESFLETAQEKLDRLNEILGLFSAGKQSDTTLLEEFRREIHSLKGMGGTFQMPLVTKLCHTFEAFIEGEDEFFPELISASHAYVDRITDLIEDSDSAIDEAELSTWIEGLPQKGTLHSAASDLPIAFIVSSSSQHADAVETSLSQEDMRVVSFQDPFDAYQQAVKEVPQLIIADQILDGMDGAELLRSLTALKSLSKAKFAMICPNRRQALEEDLKGVQLLSEKNIEINIRKFIAIAVSA